MAKKGEYGGFLAGLAGILLGFGLVRKYNAEKDSTVPDKNDGPLKDGAKTALHVAKFRLKDGSLSYSKQFAEHTDANEIVQLVTPVTHLAPGYFVGTAYRETGNPNPTWNEEDSDYKPNGTLIRTTYGVFQSNDPIDSESLQAACARFPKDAEAMMKEIAKAAGFDAYHPPRDAYAYLAWGHNAGVGEPVTSIKKNKMDWAKTISRNQAAYAAGDNDKEHGAGYMVLRMIPYANEVLKQVDLFPAKLKAV